MYKRFHYGLALAANTFGIDISELTRKWCIIYEHRLSTRGKQDAVKFCKELNSVCERYALRQNITSIPWTKSDKDGFPCILGLEFKQFLRSDDDIKVVFALSVMRSCECLRLPISKDIKSVITPGSYDQKVMDDIINYIPQWVSRLQRVSLRELQYHYTVKNGPNGHALHNSDSDISAVMNDSQLLEAIRVVEKQLKDVWPMSLKGIKADPNKIHSKLTQFPEKSGKTRTIAIVDYYSQRCLKPLHNSLMKLLATLVSDGTYSHQNVGLYAKQKTKEKSFIYCADLTAFTDRFPAEIQRVLLFELLQNDLLSQALWTILADRTFVVAWSGEQVRYQCGQPMGAYASWALCSLAHHLLVEYSGYQAGIKSCKNLYRLIGDDVIITEPVIAQNYERNIKMLGIEINLSKTVQSPTGSDDSCAEVAKQLYLNGRTLSPITPGFIRSMRKPFMFNTCLEVLRSRYEFFRPETPSILINKFFKQKNRRLVWLLCSNPIDGVIKPGNPGYDDQSPWVTKLNLESYERTYHTMIVYQMIDKAYAAMDAELAFMLQGSPWKDSTQPVPKAVQHVKRDMSKQLTKIMDSLGEISLGAEPSDLSALFDFVPDPRHPYMERHEMRQKQISSWIVSLFDYKEPEQGVTLDW